MPPVRPMLAKSVKGIPDPAKFDDGLSFEPKWDGFRCLVFKDGDEVELTSRNTKPLTRYFPEVVAALREQLPERCVLDGELFVAVGSRLEFEVLQERIHPAESRITMLAEKTPAAFVAFDVLALGDESLVDQPFGVRRERLEEALGHLRGPTAYLTRTTTDAAEAEGWFEQFEGAGLDGVVAKPLGSPYAENARTMLKIKHARTADVVVAGYRLHKNSTEERPLLGSLLLGLYADGGLQHVGVAASFTETRRAELVEELRPLECPSRSTRGPAGPATRSPTPTGCPARRAGGAPARTSPSCRCDPSACSRSATSTWRAGGSATPPSSSAGAPIGTPSRAVTSSWRNRSATTSLEFSV